MIVLLDTAHDLSTCAAELGCEVGTLLTPLTRYTLREPDRPWAIDNGAFARFEVKSFESLLSREEQRKEDCLFVTVPDVVASARRTLEVFERWAPKLHGWKLAFACQDGQEDVSVPWDAIAALFVGGSTEWKCGPHALACIKAAQALGKWVHAGRVNTPDRFSYFEELGVDSIDGTGLSRYSHMREAIAKRADQERLFA